jgi:flotillin
MEILGSLGVGLIILVVVVVIILLLVVSRLVRVYRIVPPDVALIITGGRKGIRIVTGGATFVWPMLNQAEELSLKLMLVKKQQDAVKTKSGMTVLIDWFAQVRFRTDPDSLRTAARLFLRKERDEIMRDIEEVLSGNVRAIAGDLTVEQMHNDRDAFISKVQGTAEDELKELGVEAILGIQEITDNVGYFEALAGPSIAAAKERARVATAEAEKVAGIAEQQSRQEVEQKRIDADREILTQQEALALREVEKDRRVGIEQANADKEVNDIRVNSEKAKQEADQLVPARAAAESIEIQAAAESKKISLIADANAHATKEEGVAAAQALEANLLAEAKGKRQLADAIAAEGNVNLVTPLAEIFARADVEKTVAIAEALKGVGENVKIWDFAGAPDGQNTMTKFLYQLGPMIQTTAAQVEALTGESMEDFFIRIMAVLRNPDLMKDLGTKVEPVEEGEEEIPAVIEASPKPLKKQRAEKEDSVEE